MKFINFMKIICINFICILFYGFIYNYVMFLNCFFIKYLVITFNCVELFELSKSDEVIYFVLEFW